MTIVDAHALKQPDLELFNMPFEDFHEDMLKLLDNLDHGSARIKAFVCDSYQNSGHTEQPSSMRL